MISFAEARARVPEVSLGEGYEDAEDYVVVLQDPPLDDLVVMVRKADGEVHREGYFGIRERLLKMTPVRA